MAFTNGKLLLATAISAGLFGILSYGLYEFGMAKRSFDREVEAEILLAAHSLEALNEMQQLQASGDYEGARQVTVDFRHVARDHVETSPLRKRLEANRMKREGRVEVAPPPGPGKRLKGAYYPGDIPIEAESTQSSIVALGLAGGGGLLVFGLAGLVATRVLGASGEEDGAEQDSEEEVQASPEMPQLADSEGELEAEADASLIPELQHR